ncbi:MAG: hypothetical protein HY457_00425 [Parcubacteria group bacterium]|nr:hypothetical protein [Parcubacteria group bacterium]
MKQNDYFILVGLVFVIVFTLHAFRIGYGWEATLAGWDIPMWVSWLAVIITGVLAFQSFSHSGVLTGHRKKGK